MFIGENENDTQEFSWCKKWPCRNKTLDNRKTRENDINGCKNKSSTIADLIHVGDEMTTLRPDCYSTQLNLA